MPIETKSSSKDRAPVVDNSRDVLLAKLKHVRVLREKLLMNRGEVRGADPNKAYCWVNVHKARRTFFEGLGWIVCKDEKVQTNWKRKEDGTHVRGDLILYEISKEDKEVIDLEAELSAVEAIQGSKNQFLDFAATNRVPAQLQEV